MRRQFEFISRPWLARDGLALLRFGWAATPVGVTGVSEVREMVADYGTSP